jgi:hypothetical protein
MFKAKNKKPHTTGEPLLFLAPLKICEIMHDEEYGIALKTVPCSHDTFSLVTIV